MPYATIEEMITKDKILDELVNKEFYRIIMDNTAMWLNMLDKDANVILWNKAAEKISGYSKEEVLGNNDIWELLYPDETYRLSIYDKALEIIKQGKEVTDFETTIRCKDGSNRILSWNSHDIKDESNNVIGSISLARDITAIKSSEEQLKELTLKLEESNKQLLQLSLFDSLTGIPNRRAYNERFSSEINAAKRSGNTLCLLIIDIDNFKQYNDIYGHEKGDKILYRVAQLISNTLLRKTDFVARYGGEEMIVLLPYTPPEIATLMARKILQCVIDENIEHTYSSHNKLLTVSIGISSTDTGSDELFEHADKALYLAKRNGRNRFEFYSNI